MTDITISITLHLNHLLDLPSVFHSNPKQLRYLVTTFYEHSESLKGMGHEITKNNLLLSAHLLQKLNHRTVQRLDLIIKAKGILNEAHLLL